MKKLFTILFILFLGYQQSDAQGSKKLESFKEKILPEYYAYFNKAELTENGLLNLSAVDKYISLSAEGKNAIMVKISTAWKDSVILVHYGAVIELWGWSEETENAKLLDKLNMTAPQLMKAPITKPKKMAMHPWFYYVGGQWGLATNGYINMSFNTRLGFFLLLNKWDFATTFSGGITGNTTKTSDGSTNSKAWANFGLMSRIYFPIKKLKISPNIGGQITFGSSGNTTSVYSAALILGVSWYVGFGNLDLGFSIGDIGFTSMGGYTASPKMKNKN